ncbi:hypothetical protein Ade02nite_14300 [Paractinoplanes deccanensis]|uniref:Helix-hairpin-helix domain-containing protein n=1 Tax=Paractinoplanes deccanensis TaxID=113561 RepID=A0ABQ3XYF7_9ACTN|nr:helix-hairpin-helix domain-containing protein [Actinoplanes deccanensis]GID72789.1 hypothetical protein Ade02nite_14300 [Actinoplanes deccanensis]
MTSIPPSPGPARLSWRLGHSAWVLAPILSFGCLAGAGFLYVGLRARRASWWIPGIVYSVVAFAFFAIGGEAEKDSALQNVAYAVLIAAWAASVVHALVINVSWLRWRATYKPWYAQQPSPPPPPSFAPPAVPLPPQVQPLVPPQQQFYAAPLDVNTATEQQLATLPGFGPDRAAHVVAVRRTRGGFADVNDFAAAAGLAPHEFVAVRDRLTWTPPRPPTAGEQNPYGRIVDV